MNANYGLVLLLRHSFRVGDVETVAPKILYRSFKGSFWVSKENVGNFIKLVSSEFSKDSKHLFKVKFKDETITQTGDLQELELLPIGNRDKVKSLSIEISDRGKNSLELNFELKTGSASVMVFSDTKTIELLRAGETAIPLFHSWYSVFFSKYVTLTWWLLFGLPFGALVTGKYFKDQMGISPPVGSVYLIGSVFLITLLFAIAREVLFDKIVFDFGSGKARERLRAVARKFVFGGASLLSLILTGIKFLN